MGKVPQKYNIMILVFVEDSLLNFHLHLNDWSLQMTVNLAVSLVNKFFDIFLSEDCQKFSAVGNVEMFSIVVKKCLKKRPRKQSNSIYFLIQLLQEEPYHSGD